MTWNRVWLGILRNMNELRKISVQDFVIKQEPLSLGQKSVVLYSVEISKKYFFESPEGLIIWEVLSRLGRTEYFNKNPLLCSFIWNFRVWLNEKNHNGKVASGLHEDGISLKQDVFYITYNTKVEWFLIHSR